MPRHNQQCLSCPWKGYNLEIPAGVNPACPDCGGATERNWMRDEGMSITRDEIPGGITLENYGPEPVTFYSHSERRRWMSEHGIHEKEKFSPMPGTDIDPQGIPNPAGYVDAQTLENARILICRNGMAVDTDKTEGVLVDFSSGALTNRDAAAIASGDPRRQSRLHRRTSGD